MPPRLSCFVFGSIAAILSAATPASATFIGHLNTNDSYGPNPGGEFRAMAAPDFAFTPGATGTGFLHGLGAAPGLFETFCLEMFEPLDYAVTVRADLSTHTTGSDIMYVLNPDVGGINDPIDPRTAYLYHHFIHRTLVTPYGYADEATRTGDAPLLQAAFWFIEHEDTRPLTGKALDFYNEADAAVTSGAWTGLGDVRVLNLYTLNDGQRTDYQDVLVMVPAPSAAALIGLGVVVISRRRR